MLKYKHGIENLTNVKFEPRPHLCFLYNLEGLGITPEEFAASIEGWSMDIYKWEIVGRKGGNPGRQRKCPWCDIKQDNLIEHMALAHYKKEKHLEIFKMQNALYSTMLKKVKSDKRNYFSHAVLFGATCTYCKKPRIESRFGMCALPESARNKMRSFKLLGFSCQDFDAKKLDDEWLCAIIYPGG